VDVVAAGKQDSKRQRRDGARPGVEPPASETAAAQTPVAQTGRKLGPRALQTRQRLLDAVAALLAERSVLDIPVVEIARAADTSPATFYHYFKDVDEAVLLLAENAAEKMPSMLAALDGDWRGQEGLRQARALVAAFIDHWDAHHAVLSLRNLSAEQGDPRFQRVRRAALSPVLEHLAAQIRISQEAGRVSGDLQPHIAAAALASILESLSAHYRELQTFQATRDDLIETCARILFQTLSGRAPR